MKKSITRTIQYLIAGIIVLFILRFVGDINITAIHVILLAIVALLVFFVYFIKENKKGKIIN